MNIKVRIDGVEEVIANLNTISEDVHKKVKEELIIAATHVQNGARKRCPVDTGTLRNSIAVNEVSDFKVEVGTYLPETPPPTLNVESYMPYAAFVEYGTKKMKAQPFLFPAYEEEKPKFLKRLKRIVGSD